MAAGGDTAVLLHDAELAGAQELAQLYEEHGDGFASRVRGGFAAAIRDARRGRLVLARDRFGVKPLVYRSTATRIEFASDARALGQREVDPDALEALLATGWIPPPLTVFRGVRKLPPGHLLVREEADGSERLERFARPPAADVVREDRAELVEEVRARLRDAVRAHLGGEARAGVLLSGGVHSALLAALVAQEAGATVRTFSIGFAPRELDRARRVAERLGADHHEAVVRADEALLREVADASDEPLATPAAVVAFAAARLAGADARVALSGAGGRELFGPAGEPLGATLAATDRAARAHSLDVRVPFLDGVVTNLALVPRLATPALLRAAAAPLLPRSALRGGEPVPAVGAWLRGDLARFARETLARQRQLDPATVSRLLDDHESRRADHGRRLWSLLAFALWYERHVAGEAGEAGS